MDSFIVGWCFSHRDLLKCLSLEQVGNFVTGFMFLIGCAENHANGAIEGSAGGVEENRLDLSCLI